MFWRLIHWATFHWYYRNINPKFEGKERLEKAKRAPNYLFRALFQVWNLAMSHYLLKDHPGFPKLLGGTGDSRYTHLAHGLPNWEKPAGFDFFFCSFFGFFIEDTIELLLEIKKDFAELFCHHCCALSLILFGHITNPGILAPVSYTHLTLPTICSV